MSRPTVPGPNRATVRVIVKPTASKCNQTLLDFMRGEIDTLKRVADVKVVIAYDVTKLRAAGITALPIMIVGGRVIKGAPAAIAEMKKMRGGAREARVLAGDPDDVTRLWNEEMLSKEDEEADSADSSAAMRRVEELSAARRAAASPPKKPSDPQPRPMTATVPGAGDAIRSDDELMNKYWAATTETTPM